MGRIAGVARVVFAGVFGVVGVADLSGCSLDTDGRERSHAGSDAGPRFDAGRTRSDGGDVAGRDAGPPRPGVDAGTLPPPSDAGEPPPMADAGPPPAPDAGIPPPRPDAGGPACVSIDGVWGLMGSCGSFSCSIAQSGCAVTATCGMYVFDGTLTGDRLMFTSLFGTCVLTIAGTRSTGSCDGFAGACSLDGTRFGPR